MNLAISCMLQFGSILSINMSNLLSTFVECLSLKMASISTCVDFGWLRLSSFLKSFDFLLQASPKLGSLTRITPPPPSLIFGIRFPKLLFFCFKLSNDAPALEITAEWSSFGRKSFELKCGVLTTKDLSLNFDFIAKDCHMTCYKVTCS